SQPAAARAPRGEKALDPLAHSIRSSRAPVSSTWLPGTHERSAMQRSPSLSIALAGACIVTLAAVMATALPARGYAAERNLLVNPGFEDVMTGHPWMPAGWDTSASGLPTSFFGRDTFLVPSGHYAANVANISTFLPISHNWSQSVEVGREVWGKDAVFSVWTRSNGVEGRAYCLLQAYRDTISKMAK